MSQGRITSEQELRAVWERDRGIEQVQLRENDAIVGVCINLDEAGMKVKLLARPTPELIPWSFFSQKGCYAVVVAEIAGRIITSKEELDRFWGGLRDLREPRLMNGGKLVGTCISAGRSGMIVQKPGRPTPEPVAWSFFQTGGYIMLMKK